MKVYKAIWKYIPCPPILEIPFLSMPYYGSWYGSAGRFVFYISSLTCIEFPRWIFMVSHASLSKEIVEHCLALAWSFSDDSDSSGWILPCDFRNLFIRCKWSLCLWHFVSMVWEVASKALQNTEGKEQKQKQSLHMSWGSVAVVRHVSN